MLKNFLRYNLLLLLLISCKSSPSFIQTPFKEIQIDTLLNETISIRALDFDNSKVYYAGNKNRVGYIDISNGNKFERTIQKDSLNLDFRSIAITDKGVLVMCVANPALMYRFSKDLLNKQLVYQENNQKVFYDAMKFWNNNEGMVLGDPIDGVFSILFTNDGGLNWNKRSPEYSPKALDGEAVFATSNSNINSKNNKLWFVSGGKAARVFISSDKGVSWKSYPTPIVQGKAMTGIFTADFFDNSIGIIAGGDYDHLNQNFSNKAITTNGGKTWKLISDNKAFGYTSCIQFVPGTKGRGIVSVGASGIYYSNDKGANWTQLSADSSLFTLRFIDCSTAIAAGKNKIIKLKFL